MHIYHMKTNEEKDELNLITLAQEYADEDKARGLLESLLWPDGAVCPHCKNHKEKPIYKLQSKEGSKTKVRKGLYKCGACRKPFTVTVGTIFEDSHLPISKWLMAFFIICSSKKSISANQLSRMLKITYKAAWFMAHRLRFSGSKSSRLTIARSFLHQNPSVWPLHELFSLKNLPFDSRANFSDSESSFPALARTFRAWNLPVWLAQEVFGLGKFTFCTEFFRPGAKSAVLHPFTVVFAICPLFPALEPQSSCLMAVDAPLMAGAAGILRQPVPQRGAINLFGIIPFA